ncbi:CBO0543 family protein [Neobacillus soli]|uniref:CBO0543 family protein n=1 Tax=Neobacillus soli TaxID=220688 RepID=UPI000B0E7A6F|nr:CBO0543 family protein [Neobacillus soli]
MTILLSFVWRRGEAAPTYIERATCMPIEYLIIILMWVIGVISFVKFTPKNHHRRVIFAVLVCQSLTWLNTLFHVKFNLLSFPVRELPKATDVLVTTEYLFYPLVCGFYIISVPKKVNNYLRPFYLSLWVSGLTIFDVIIEKYTNLIVYVHYDWYWTWLDFFCLFAVVNIIYHWFFKEKAQPREDKEATR